jgi:uncharacterized membrane protein YjjB (DUF3815 family)
MIVVQIIVAAFATLSFSVLFSAPKSEYLYCGITGAIGWLFYLLAFAQIRSMGFATFIAALIITLFSRIFAVNRRVPVTVFLIAGIFPLVPGTEIYYTAYNLFHNDISAGVEHLINAMSVATAIAFGVMMIFLIPQKIFLVGKNRKERINMIKKWY